MTFFIGLHNLQSFVAFELQVVASRLQVGLGQLQLVVAELSTVLLFVAQLLLLLLHFFGGVVAGVAAGAVCAL